ncbi:hypothetical protein H1C71_040574 [Ictidomys tridecemlineatus]|nr:hypothetical protein H1C71_040574 [Ictidomys tridecemlineatus]
MGNAADSYSAFGLNSWDKHSQSACFVPSSPWGVAKDAKQGRFHSLARGRSSTETLRMGLMECHKQSMMGMLRAAGCEQLPGVFEMNRKSLALTEHLFCDRYVTYTPQYTYEGTTVILLKKSRTQT